ncbi:jerky protein homolog-like [Macrosteles quadrilineatus]|uniref:jerky protein homolog-like n=1 Tax=Macrosteles quadrilineatus TaxID=74068 RepID=UPI0023E2D0C4|nr:jerky protein homolog-like [Macrosteles quadrilineatus]
MTLFNYCHQNDGQIPESQPQNQDQNRNPPPHPITVPAQVTLRTPGHPTVFTREEEVMLCENLATVGDWGFPVSGFQLQCIIEAYLNSIGREVPCFKNGTRPGPDWVSSFLKRNSATLKARNCTNIKKTRAAVSRDVIEEYFKNLGKVVPNIPPGNIVNYDETNFSDDPKCSKMIYRRKVKRAERIINFTKTAFSVMFAVTDGGDDLPVYVVYKGQHKWSTWTKNGPKYARYNSTKSGWFDEETFHEWFTTIVLPWAESREGIKMLIGDNLSSHFCPDVIKKCEEYDIHFVCLPKNSTHLTQPLDVAVFAPMKRVWRTVLLEWKSREGKSLTSLPKDQFPGLLKKCSKKWNLP